jgi:hypothetical protein
MTPAQRRIAESRAELEDIFAPPDADSFPRSDTMRFMTGGKGRMVALGLFAGLLLVKPKLAAALLRFLPLGQLMPVARNLIKALR